MHHDFRNNAKQPFDHIIQQITDYVCDYKIKSDLAYKTAYYTLLDSIACALMALKFPACTKLLGPVVPGATLKDGARVIGCDYELDPVQASFNNGALIRWLDFNDTFLAAEWGHPSDNLGGILSVCDYLNRLEDKKLTVKDILTAAIKAHEIQGVFALENSFNRVGLDHVFLVKLATTAVVAELIGCTQEQINNAVSQVFVDGQALRTYRHAPNTGSRKSWAAGDASARGVRLALLSRRGEMGYPSVLSAKTWGFYDVSFKGKSFEFARPFESYIMENVLFKISFPAEFHAQTAVECALKLHPLVKNKLDHIDKIIVHTQEAGMRIISKQGPLHNPADRDHCLEYMIAIPLIYGGLTAEHYEDTIAKNPLIDQLREKMHVSEDKQFTKDYFDPNKRAIGNAIKIIFKDGTETEEVHIDYPIGHKNRREEGIPHLIEKFKKAVQAHYEKSQAEKLIAYCLDEKNFAESTTDALMQRLKK